MCSLCPSNTKEEANRLVSGLTFTVDSQEKIKDNKCPMLDLKVWRELGKEGCAVIRHTYYKKEVTLPLVFHARGHTCGEQSWLHWEKK